VCETFTGVAARNESEVAGSAIDILGETATVRDEIGAKDFEAKPAAAGDQSGLLQSMVLITGAVAELLNDMQGQRKVPQNLEAGMENAVRLQGCRAHLALAEEIAAMGMRCEC
jgi:hypothetical protein